MNAKRRDLRDSIEELCTSNEAASNMLKKHNRQISGRPRKEIDQPDLLSTIVTIVQASSATDDRRRTESLHSLTTLDDLHKELKTLGFNLSRSAVYLRLLPRRGDSREGKRHVQTVPIKLLRPENSLRKKNIDRMYAKSFFDDMMSVSELLGSNVVNFLSNDDKARIALGLAAATLQAPILMHLDYRVQLPDHDFVIGTKHKLIPSVYGVCDISPKDGKVTYSGETFIRVRSGKHDISSAYTHAYDVRELFTSNLIERKPVLIMGTDGAADEAPRFPKTLSTAVDLFKMLELDALIHGVNAAGLSAFNPVERRMAPLSHDLAGIILPHDSFGDHLDSSGKTIDEELEKRNFFRAAEILSDIWSKTVIDGKPVSCEAVPTGRSYVPSNPDVEWVSRHVLQARYSLQIVKCFDQKCCKPFVSDWPSIFPERFIPAPIVYKYGNIGVEAVKPVDYFANPKKYEFASLTRRLLLKKLPPTDSDATDKFPFDTYCPSMEKKT